MNRQELIKAREEYLNSEAQRIFERALFVIGKWQKNYVEKGVIKFNLTNENEHVISSVKDILTTNGYEYKIHEGFGFDGYPDDTIIEITNI